MSLLSRIYLIFHRDGREIPYYYKYSLWTVITKPIRKLFSAIIIPACPFSSWRIWMYRMCGYKIGKNVFIGMRCYLDDMCYDKITIGDNVIISYGVFFACHGRKQGHNRLVIEDGAYIGMRTSIIVRQSEGLTIGKNAVVGACSLVNKSIPEGKTAVGIPIRILD